MKIANQTLNAIPNSSKKMGKFKLNYSHLQLTFMCIPVLLLVALFNYFPMFGLLIAFKDYKFNLGILGSKWIGFENFKFFFTSQDVFNVTRNTILLNLGLIISYTVISIIIAIMLYEVTKKVLIKTYQTVLFIPYFISWVVVAYIAYAFLNEGNGIFNNLLESIGAQPVSWYSESKLWPAILIFAGTWKIVGYNTVLYYSSLMSIDSEYFEAAALDGANKVQTIWYIMLPSLLPLIIMLTMLSIGRIFYSDFGLFYFLPMQSGSLISATDVIDTYIYRSLRVVGDLGMSSAVNFYQSTLGLIMILVSNYIVKKINSDYSLF